MRKRETARRFSIDSNLCSDLSIKAVKALSADMIEVSPNGIASWILFLANTFIVIQFFSFPLTKESPQPKRTSP